MNASTMPTLPVTVLAPAGEAKALAGLLGGLGAPGEPFGAPRRETLAQLSRAILQDTALRADAASVALGYWLRRANVDRLAAGFAQRAQAAPDTVFVPCGRVFHVAPGNVDTVFVYSWALSYLCGNVDVVRVSTQQNEVLARLLALLSALMRGDAELAAASRFITYEHDRATSEALSGWATHRVVWGGDATVSLLRALPLSPHASERMFASKFSYAAIDSAAYLAADDARAAKLAADFFNDLFWFDQMACSSPHLVVWVGTEAAMMAAVEGFDRRLAAEVQRHAHRGSAAHTMQRLNFVFDLACSTPLEADLRQQEFLAVRLLGEQPAIAREVCGAGLFMHTRADDLRSVAALAGERDQTVTHYGFAAEALREYARHAGARGVDRIVPIGEALAFAPVWDGYDLIGDFLRQVTVRAI